MDPDELIAEERLGDVINGKWTLERLLGVGGMAAVYAARDKEGNVAAVKILHPEMSRRADVRDRFLREGETASLVGHPGIVQMHHDETTDGDTVALVMELLEGHCLTDVIEQKGLGTDELLDVLDQVLDALAAAHDKGIVHRDLKPDNLFLTREGKIKILDFGIARISHEVPGRHKTKTGVALGTVPYMAPEQALARHGQVDGRTDLFAIGAIAFRVVTGRYIHVADTDPELLIAMASKSAPPVRSIAPDVPADVAVIIDVALAFSKDARYPDARTMQEDVRAVRQGKSPPYASPKHSTREVPTRMDLAAPVFPPPSSQSPPSAFAPTEVDLGPPPASTIRPAEPSKTPTEISPAPPVPSTTAAGASKSVPPQPAAKKLRFPLILVAAALVGVGTGVFLMLQSGSSNENPPMTVDTSQNVDLSGAPGAAQPSPTSGANAAPTTTREMGAPGGSPQDPRSTAPTQGNAGNTAAFPPSTEPPATATVAPTATATAAPTATATPPTVTGTPAPTATPTATPTAPPSEPPKPPPTSTPTATSMPTTTAPQPTTTAPAPTATSTSTDPGKKKKGRKER